MSGPAPGDQRRALALSAGFAVLGILRIGGTPNGARLIRSSTLP